MKEKKDARVTEQLAAYDTGCDFKLSNFEGPLDLLLHLIKDDKIEITEVKLAEVTNQYLEYMVGLDELDLEKASDFIEIAATLIEMKSKNILPTMVEETSDEEDSGTLLLRRLNEYRIIKEASEKLSLQENVNRFYKPADEKVNDVKYVLGQLNLDGLLDAFAKMLTRVKKEENNIVPRKIEKDRFTVAEKIISIRQSIKLKKKMRFSEFFESDYTQSEMINLFLAVLELLKMQEIIAKQDSTYAEINIELKQENEEKEESNASWY